MKWICCLILGVLGCTFAWGQGSVFDRFDFVQGGYTLLFRPLNTTYAPPFFIRDVARLQAIKERFRLRHNAGYRYMDYADLSLLVCKNGEVVEKMGIFESRRILCVASTQSVYDFDGAFPVEGYALAKQQVRQFANVAAARAALDSLSRGMPGLICVLPPDWRLFDGRFTVLTERTKLDVSAFEKQLREMIMAKYPGVAFDLKLTSASVDWLRGTDYRLTVACMQPLAERFDLYPRVEGDWQPFPLELVSYWEK